jgi:hypothetical protein
LSVIRCRQAPKSIAQTIGNAVLRHILRKRLPRRRPIKECNGDVGCMAAARTASLTAMVPDQFLA